MTSTGLSQLFLVAILVLGTNAGIPPIASICSVQWTPSSSYEIFNDLIHNNMYNKDIRPINASDTTSTATNVQVNFYVGQVHSIDKVNGQFKTQFLFRQKWVDSRLAYEDTSKYQNQCNGNKPQRLALPASMFDYIWTPDLYIVQEVESMRHSLFQPNRLVKVYPNGTVLLSQRITVTLACPLFANNDSQSKECDMNIESYGFVKDEIKLDWTDEHPIYVSQDIFIPSGFALKKVTPSKCDTEVPSGIYSCLQGKFFFSKV
jgi:hypothetical protein